MKKIIFILITIFSFSKVTNANEWSDELLKKDYIEKEYRYRFYKENKQGEYVRISDNKTYQYEEIDNYIYSDYGEYQNICEEQEGIEIEQKTKYQYKKKYQVQYIKIINNNKDKNIIIKDFEVQEDTKVVNSKISNCVNCTIENDDYIINSIGVMTIELENAIDIDKMIINLNFENNDPVSFTLDLRHKDDSERKHLVSQTTSNTSISEYKINSNYYISSLYDPTVYTDYDITLNKYIQVIKKENVCRTREKMIYKYNITKEYYDENYYKSLDDIENMSEEEKQKYQKDTEDYKIYYRYIEENDNNLDNSNEENDNNIDNSNEEKEDEINNTIIKNKEEIINDNELKLVKTGIEENILNYDFLILYILILLLVALILLKYIKKLSIKNNN